MSSDPIVAYQIDHQVTSKGKTFGVSKKKITFKFGFANGEALSNGMVGANCRGSEHEIIFVWSLNSGKRQILVDGKEVHYSESGANGWTSDRTFQHVFSLRTPGYGTCRCHLITLSPQQMQQVNSKRPFDLRVNGISYFNFCKIFQLGTPSQMHGPQMSAGAGGPDAPRNDPEVDPYASPEERRLIAQAKLESLRDLRNNKTSAPAPSSSNLASTREEESLISFDDAGPTLNMPQNGQRQVSNITMDPNLSPANASVGGGGFNQQPPQQQPYPTQYAPPAAAPGALTPWQPSTPGSVMSGQSYNPPAPAPAAPGWQVPPAPNAYGGGAPAPAPMGTYGAPPPPGAGGYGAAPPPVNTGAIGTPGGPMPFTSPSSVMSYGSAPSFAQPPPQQQQPPPPPQQQPFAQPYTGF
mmetsp:Transcript_27964/g.42839  ORF Transcript_27964/g.42839 Transcript_27964/m.42839 type:complete len:410 (-) Transcript_27964:369-1598(-)|eukprot:CAMPEP_0195283944 /NCGR_PEP_ID=MMETSP0707-20130614/2317_1 /TAXON_ID=33640 /ORGANISM="Asterionellopsis glacialis, Strain CCMP134" /LENGTH=409 /DNA_ID=CAMNT_0040343203 /DNA_START=234 /DNA_END=1463 /DNA_ORIENTATION=-